MAAAAHTLSVSMVRPYNGSAKRVTPIASHSLWMLGKYVGAGADLDEEAGARVAVDAQPHAHAMERSLWASALGDFPSTQAARLLRRT